jgi:hypothetical protein
MKPIYKALFWYFWNMIFGVAPFLIFGYLWISIDDKILSETIKLEIFHLVRDFVFIFYCVAMTGNISLDFLFSKYRFPYHIYFIMGVVPCTVFGIVALNYSVLILNKLENANIQKLVRIQAIIFIVITVFCIFAKEKLLSKENRLLKLSSHE